MRIRSACLLAILVLSACGREPSSFVVAPNDVWVRDVTLISSERETPLPNAHVVVRGDRIAWIGTDAPAGATTAEEIDGTGMYLVPGLIDGHVHLASVPGMSREQVAAMPEIAEAYYRQLPRSYLYFGFTTVVDVNVTNPEVVERVRSAELGPSVLDCGNALVLANGYPMANRPFPQRFESYPNFLYDPRQADSIPGEYSVGDQTPEAAVGRVVEGGGKCVKAFFELGPGDWPVPTLEMMRQVRELSYQRGIPLLLHANSLEAHRFAADAGVDAVAHGLWNWQSLRPENEEELPLPVRAVLEAEKQTGIAYMPSMRVLSGIGDLFDPAFLDREGLAHVVPPAFLDWLRTPEARWYADEMTQGGVSRTYSPSTWTPRASGPRRISPRKEVASCSAATLPRIRFTRTRPGSTGISSSVRWKRPPYPRGRFSRRRLSRTPSCSISRIVTARSRPARLRISCSSATTRSFRPRRSIRSRR